MAFLMRPLTPEQRESVKAFALVRWVLVASLLVVIEYPFETNATKATLFVVLIGVALAANGVLQLQIARRGPIPMLVPLAVGAYDAAGITLAIAIVDGFDNNAYVLYYPALMAFSALFPGRISLTYSAAIMLAYSTLSVSAYERFDSGSENDWRDLGIRMVTMGAAVLASYLFVRVERERRVRAVEAETARQLEVHALEHHTRELERAAESERRRLVREVHDGISQGIYMLSLGLETAAHQLAVDPAANGDARARLEALVRLSKQTLLDARGLLFDLGRVMGGEANFDTLIAHQAEEFRAITGVAAEVTITGQPHSLPPPVVAEAYRVLQEALANIYRHSGARSVRVEVAYSPESVVLRVGDDGRGFDPREVAGRGNGLRTMRERADILGADLSIDSNPGCGATLTLKIPAQPNPSKEAVDVHHPNSAG